MKNTVIKYGTYGFFLAIALFLGGLYFLKGLSFSAQEIIGYASMIASLAFVFFGIKHYRDKENQGNISFKKALIIGLLISVFTAIGIGISDYIYTTVINPNFFEEYVATMRAQGYTEEIPEWSSGFMAFIMFSTVLTIGLIISLISAWILQRKN